MLKSLRKKFVIVIMALVGMVLFSVLGGSYVSTWQTQHAIIDGALKKSLEGNMPEFPRMGTFDSNNGFDRNRRDANVLILCIDLDSNGIVLATNNAPVLVDQNSLAEVLSEIISGNKDSMWDSSKHIAWSRTYRGDGAWRVAIADTSTTDVLLSSLLIKDIIICVVAMGLLLLIAFGLSSWMLEPVEEAWNQQRQFVADASHELKTPLAVIIANNQILLKDEGIPKESMRWIESTADESIHMKGLVEDLLELARTDETIAGSAGIMKSDRVDFSALVENAALEFDAIAFERGTSIDEHIASDVSVQGDQEWLARLCKILVDNACKYASPGTVVSVSLEKDGKRCKFTVNNKGNTIDAEDLPHVFDRFYRTDKARSRSSKASGFGLGLAIAKGIVTAHNGTIAATSDETNGTTFEVVLPTMA